MRSNNVFWILALILVTAICDNGTQQSLTLVSTQPTHNSTKNESMNPSQSVHNKNQAELLNTTALKKAIEKVQNETATGSNQQQNRDNTAKNQFQGTMAQTTKQSNDKLQNIHPQQVSNATNNDVSLKENQKQENQPQKKEQFTKNQTVSNQPKIAVQNGSSEKINPISTSIDIPQDKAKEQQLAQENSEKVKVQVDNAQNVDKKVEEKGQMNTQPRQEQTSNTLQKEQPKSDQAENKLPQLKQQVLDKKQAEQKVNNFKIDDITPLKQFQSLGNLRPILSNMTDENPSAEPKHQMSEAKTNNQPQTSAKTNNKSQQPQSKRSTYQVQKNKNQQSKAKSSKKELSGLRQPEKTILFRANTPEINVTSLEIPLTNITTKSALASVFPKSKDFTQQTDLKKETKDIPPSSSQISDKKQMIKETPQKEDKTIINPQKEEKSVKSSQQEIKRQEQKTNKTEVDLPTNDTSVKQAAQKIAQELKIQNITTKFPDKTRPDPLKEKVQEKQLKDIEQKGKTMKNPEQSDKTQLTKDTTIPKKQMQATKKLTGEQNKTPEPPKKQKQVNQLITPPLNTQTDINKLKKTQETKLIEQNQNPQRQRTGRRNKSSNLSQQQSQRIKELIKMRKERDQKRAKHTRNDNQKYQVVNKFQNQKAQANLDRQRQQRSNLLNKQTHLTNQKTDYPKTENTNFNNKFQHQNKQQKHLAKEQKVSYQNRLPKQLKKQDSLWQALFEIFIFLVILAIAIGLYSYFTRQKDPVQPAKGSLSHLKDSQQDEIEIAQRADEDS